MRIVRLLPIFAAFALLGGGHAKAQSMWAQVVPSCGAPPVYYAVGQSYPILMDEHGNFCVTAAGTPTVNNNAIGATPINVAINPTNAPAFTMPGPAVLSRWRASCNCFTSPP